MAKRLAIPSKELQLHVVGPKESYKVSRAQRLSLNTDVPSTTIDEIGSALHAGEVKDLPNVTLTFSVFDVGVKLFSALTGTDSTSFPGAGVDIANLGEIDAILFVKDPDAADYVKSAHAKRLQVRDFTFNYSVDGESTEDYTAVGSEKRWLKYDVVVDKFTVGTTSFSLSQTPIQLNNTNYLLSVILDGEYLTEVVGVPATGEYSVSGTTLTTGDSRSSQCMAVYHSNASAAWSDVSDAVQAIAIRGGDADVLISANAIQRVQSVTINGTLNTQPVREMGNRNVVGYQAQVPTVEGTVTVLDTDTELMELFTYGTIGSGQEWQPGEGCTTTEVSLEIQLVDPCDTSVPYTVLKTIYVPDVVIVGDAYASNVNQNATQTFNWKSADGQCIIYSGAR